VLLSASQDGQSARVLDNDRGLFTAVVVETWDGGAFLGTYSSFHTTIESKVSLRSTQDGRPAQTPNLLLSPRNQNPLAIEPPFTIDPVSSPASAVQPSNAGPVVVSGQPQPAGG
jgi:hypothetical protein